MYNQLLLYAITGPARFTISEVAVDWQEPMVLQRKLRPSNCTRITYNWIRVMQLANTPPLQSTAPGLHPVSIHQTSPLVLGSNHPITAYYSIYRPRKDERLSRPAWLVTYRNKVPPPGVEPVHVTHPSTNRARRRVTSLIRPTLLPLRHTATPPIFTFLPSQHWLLTVLPAVHLSSILLNPVMNTVNGHRLKVFSNDDLMLSVQLLLCYSLQIVH